MSLISCWNACQFLDSSNSMFRKINYFLRWLNKSNHSVGNRGEEIGHWNLSNPSLDRHIKELEFRITRSESADLYGQYLSIFKGAGIDYESTREYTQGDDTRFIDWNRTAKSNEIWSKEFREERGRTVLFLVDNSMSMIAPPPFGEKTLAVLQVLTLLGYSAVSAGDLVGLITFSSDVHSVMRPRKGKGNVLQIMRRILQDSSDTNVKSRQGTDVAKVIQFSNRLLKQGSVVFILSDFVDITSLETIRLLARKHDVTVVRIDGPDCDLSMENGLIDLLDVETGRSKIVDFTDFRGSDELFLHGGKKKSSGSIFQELGVSELVLNTNSDITVELLTYLRVRSRRMFRQL